MENKKELEPDLILSKDGKILHRSDVENVRAYSELFCSYLPELLSRFGRFR